MIRNKIKDLIKKAIKQAQKEKSLPDFKIPEPEVEHPAEKTHGDYSTNVAMKIATGIMNQESGIKNSIEIAKALVKELKNLKVYKDYFEKIEVAGPGFINFTLSKKWLQEQVGEILSAEGDADKNAENTLKTSSASNQRIDQRKFSGFKKVQIEFISANPTGPLHLGHGRGAFWGDTLANVLEKAGFDVKREYYINDAKISRQIRELGRTVLGKGEAYLTDYLKGKIEEFIRRNNADKNAENTLKTSSASNQRIDQRKFSGLEAGYLIAQEIHRDIRRFIEEKLKIKFDKWVSEEKLYQEGKASKVEELLRSKDLVYEKGGATWLKTSKFGDDKDRVLVKRDGQPTYLLPDIAYHKDKFERGFDKVIDIWGADHLGHIKPVKIGLKILGHNPQKLEILISQMVRLKIEGEIYKMSKRKGKIINLEWLIDEIGLDAVRFLYLMKSLDTQMEFDLDLAKEKSEKNPVFYVQYAYARICSILRKAPASLLKLSLKGVEAKLLRHSAELDLIRQLIKFPEIVEDTSRDYQVQRLPAYALEVGHCFHYFYKCCRVISENKDLTEARLGLVLATKVVLENVLKLMGISAPKRM